MPLIADEGTDLVEAAVFLFVALFIGAVVVALLTELDGFLIPVEVEFNDLAREAADWDCLTPLLVKLLAVEVALLLLDAGSLLTTLLDLGTGIPDILMSPS